jgi:hypothetical protein
MAEDGASITWTVDEVFNDLSTRFVTLEPTVLRASDLSY